MLKFSAECSFPKCSFPLRDGNVGTNGNGGLETPPVHPVSSTRNEQGTDGNRPEQTDLQRLLNAGMLACQFWGDSKHARAEMRRQLREVPPGDRQTWTEHFLNCYGESAHG